MNRLSYLALAALLSGCSMNVTLMPRDSGSVYRGELTSSGNGSGSMKVDLAGRSCTGPASRVASGESVGVISTFGGRGAGVGTVVSSGDARVMALLTCSDGTGLRCEFTGRDGQGGGVCVDDARRVYDVLISQRCRVCEATR